MIRNGNDVIQSTVNAGFYTDEWCMNMVEKRKRHKDCILPYYLNRESAYYWNKYTPLTRAATVWRQLTEKGIRFEKRHSGRCDRLRYEDLLNIPETFAYKYAENYFLDRTELTDSYEHELRNHVKKTYRNITYDIQPPERAKYIKFMAKLGYTWQVRSR
jgi:hypothetical protein